MLKITFFDADLDFLNAYLATSGVRILVKYSEDNATSIFSWLSPGESLSIILEKIGFEVTF